MAVYIKDIFQHHWNSNLKHSIIVCACRRRCLSNIFPSSRYTSAGQCALDLTRHTLACIETHHNRKETRSFSSGMSQGGAIERALASALAKRTTQQTPTSPSNHAIDNAEQDGSDTAKKRKKYLVTTASQRFSAVSWMMDDKETSAQKRLFTRTVEYFSTFFPVSTSQTLKNQAIGGTIGVPS